MYADADQIPSELKKLDTFLLWKNFAVKGGKKIKSPVSKTGLRMGYNNPDALMPFKSAKERLSKGNDLGIGISLLDGIEVSVDKDSGYLWCLDFDGFAKAENNQVDDGVIEFVDTFPSYTEISPSGTGFKYFFVCDRKPQSKYKIKFGPSEFSKECPNITKYAQREIEVFSRNGFLALTGQLFNSSTDAIKFLSNAELDSMLERLNKWATSTGGSGHIASSIPSQNSVSIPTNTLYSKLTKSSLEAVLAFVDHVDEQAWTDTSNVLARVYGEEGRPYFQSYSSGDYADIAYPKYDRAECDTRFNRALSELKNRSDGYGLKHLVNLAISHPNWPNLKLEYEEVNPFKNLVSQVSEVKYESTERNVVDVEDAFFEDVSQGLLEQIRGYSITGQSKKLKENSIRDVFLMDRIAILGQWTVIYAAPGTGKTLLTLWMLRDQISKGLIEANKVFYVNADDNFRGMTEKVEIAEGFGLQMLVPNFNDFSINIILTLMGQLAESGEARGIILVLDTLKKFTDLMDKRVSSHFGNIARQFITAGGSLIVLAHTNKHKDAEGKSIYSGTSDIVDDADCVFIIDKVGECDEFLGKKITVKFTNKKSRGDVASTLGFTYVKGGQSYSNLLDSVERIDEKGLETSKRELEIEESLEKDNHIISVARQAIIDGFNTKDRLVKEVKKRTLETTARVKSVIEKRAGSNYASGDRWSFTLGEKNAQIFSVLPPPLNIK